MVQFFLYGLTELVEKGKMEKKVYDFPRYYEVIRNLQPQACISACDEDLGSRKALENEKDLIWYPAEVNTSIRPGWFYHPEEDNGVRPLSELIDMYYKSVGGNATFLLNIPPSPLGLFHQNDVQRLKEIGDYLNKSFGKSIAKELMSIMKISFFIIFLLLNLKSGMLYFRKIFQKVSV